MFNSTTLCALVLLLSALMLHYFVVAEESFQVQRTTSRRPSGRARRAAPAPAAEAAPAPAPTPATVATCPPCPTLVAAAPVTATVAPAAPSAALAPAAPTAVAPVSTPAPTVDVARVDQRTAPAQPSMPFSELVNSLITYKPIQNAQQIYGQPLNYRTSLDGTAVSNIESVPAREISRDVKKIRMGVKDIQNILKSERSSNPVVPTTPSANSNALQQGNWFRSNMDGGCPYAMGQQADCPVRPVDDMSDYIRKDSIPCWGCTLK